MLRTGVGLQRLLLLLCFIGTLSCNNDGYPKPKAYPRLTYPEANYQTERLKEAGVRFQRPVFCQLNKVPSPSSDASWYNLQFPGYNVVLHLSFLRIKPEQLKPYLAEKERLVHEQAPPMSSVTTSRFNPLDKRLSGMFFSITGDSPSPTHFLLFNQAGKLCSGSLMFSNEVSADSISDVLNGINKDIRHLMETFYFEP